MVALARIFGRMATIQRLAWRSAMLLGFTLLGFALMEGLVYFGQERILDLHTRFPEMMLIIRAMTIMTWAEVCLLWIRIAVQPQIDVQYPAKIAEDSPMPAAIIYTVHQVCWLARIVLFLHLCEFI